MEILLAEKASKELKNLPWIERKKVEKKLLSLKENPLTGKKLTAELSSYRSLRAWPYRIIYSISQKQIIIKSIIPAREHIDE